MIPSGAELAAKDGLDRRRSIVIASWVIAAFVLAAVCPGVPFVLAPALFGVVHVAGDYRHLIARRALPRDLTLCLLAGSLGLLVVRALQAVAPQGLALPKLEVVLGWGMVLAAALLAPRPGVDRRRWFLTLGLLAAAAVAAFARPLAARLLFAHAHNVVGIVLWWTLFRPRSRGALAAVGLVLLGTLALLALASTPLTSFASGWSARCLADTTLGMPVWLPHEAAARVGVCYVFLQVIHYGVWLVWIPSADLSRAAPSTLRQRPRHRARYGSLRAAYADLGRGVTALVALGALAIIGASFVDAHRTRQFYLSMATFHGYLELAAGLFIVLRAQGEQVEATPRGALVELV